MTRKLAAFLPLLFLIGFVLSISVGSNFFATPLGFLIDWPFYAGDLHGNRYSPIDTINAGNVKDLSIAWTWKSNPADGELDSRVTPLAIGGRLYFPVGDRGSVVAVDGSTGKTVWISHAEGSPPYPRVLARHLGQSVAYANGQIYTFTPALELVRIDASTGRVIWKAQPHLDSMTVPVGSLLPPLVVKNMVIVGLSGNNRMGAITAFDARGGQVVWKYYTVPKKGEFGFETWLNNSAEKEIGAGVSGPMAVDEDLGLLYVPLDSPRDLADEMHPGNNLFSSTLIALDLNTGRRKWHYQFVHHDIWQYGLSGSPILADLAIGDRRIKAVIQLSRQGSVYAADRVTGQPIWPIEERPVPQSGAGSPTQPFPAKPPAFERQGLTTNDLIDFTPDLRRLALEALRGFSLGPIYSSPVSGTISVPGISGGSDWEGGALDPETGFLYVGSAAKPSLAGSMAPTVDGLSLIKPPYGRITAYDMNRGDIVWQIANGDTPPEIRNHPRLAGVNLPPTGSASQAGLLVTRHLLFAGEGEDGQPYFRAYDKRTGAVVWEKLIPGGSQVGLPMTYGEVISGRESKQYIVFSFRGADSKSPAQLVAFGLTSGPTTTTTITNSVAPKPLAPPPPTPVLFPVLTFESEMIGSNGNKTIQGGERFTLRVRISNKGSGGAQDVVVKLAGDPLIIGALGAQQAVGNIPAGETKTADFTGMLTPQAPTRNAEFDIRLSESRNDQPDIQTLRVGLIRAEVKRRTTVLSEVIEVDDPPEPVQVPGRQSSLAIVIGITDYRDPSIPKVPFGSHDAEVFAKYVQNIAGVRKENIKVLRDANATLTDISETFEQWLRQKAQADSTILIYYAGHGAMDPSNGNVYLVPFEGRAESISRLYSLDKLYQNLESLPTKDITVFLDACFSGGGRSITAQGTRPLLISGPKTEVRSEKIAVLAAAGPNQISSDYDRMKHGLFTYFLLKGLRGDADSEKDGWISMQKLYEYVSTNVSRTALDELSRDQNPVLLGSAIQARASAIKPFKVRK